MREKEKSMKKFFAVLGSIFLLTAVLSFAQEQTGQIIGVVIADTGEALQGVTIEARSPKLMGIGLVETDRDGRFLLTKLPVGTYTVTFKLPGFATVVMEEVVIRLGQSIRLDVELRPVTIEEEVTVIGESPIVDIRTSASTYSISREMFTKLPKGRDFSSVITVAAGVNEESELTGISFDGASSSENMFFIDGVDTTTMYDGVSGQNVMFEFVEEVQVKSSGYEAQYGGSMGGVINVITRSGGNEYHGEVLLYHESSSLDGEPRPSLRIAPYDITRYEYITYPEDDWKRFEIGIALGGYLIKDKLWFFGSYLPRFEQTTRETFFLPDEDIMKTFTRADQWHHGNIKISAQPFSKLRMHASWSTDYSQYRGSLPSQAGTSPIDYNWAGSGYNYPGYTAALRADYIFSDNLFLSTSGGIFRTNVENLVGPPGERYYFYTTNVGVPGVPAAMERPQYWYNYPGGDRYQLLRDIQYKYTAALDGTLYVDLAGEHMFKAGVQFVRISQDVFDAAPYDSWYFEWMEPYQSPSYDIPIGGTFGTVTNDYGIMYAYDPLGTVAATASNRIAIYLQDSWTIGNKLTLNFGVRAEKEDIPSFVDPESQAAIDHPEFLEPPIAFDFVDKLAPRFGFAYDVFGDASLKVFGSAGIYYDVMKLDMAEGSYGGYKWLAHYYLIPPSVVTDWMVGERDHPSTDADLANYFIETLDWRIPSYDTTQPSSGTNAMKPYSKMELSFGVQRQLFQDVSITVRYLHNKILWAIEDIGVQTPAGEQYYNGNPGSDWINEIYAEQAAIDPTNYVPVGVNCPRAKRNYHSVDIGFDKRFSNDWMAGLHYTWSKLWGNFAGLASSEEHGRKDPNVERYFDAWFLHYTSAAFSNGVGTESLGLLATDRPHQFKLYGAYSLDVGLTLGFNAFAATGTPVTREFELNRADGYYPEGRFTDGRTPFLWRADLYAEYNMKLGEKNTLQLNMNVYNITNNRIAQRLYNVANFGTVYLDNDEIIAGFNYEDVMQAQGITPNPQFLQEYAFQSPIAVRLGVKLIF